MYGDEKYAGYLMISIHALRGEGDAAAGQSGIARKISIHALRGEGDLPCCAAATAWSLFLSTPSVGRATSNWASASAASQRFLSTPSVGRATDIAFAAKHQFSISIHALRGEGDVDRPPR